MRPGAVLGDELSDIAEQPRAPVDRSVRRGLAPLLVVVVAAPLAIGSLSLVGDTWHPVGDWASMLFRIGQVGSRDTPLVGTYTVKGWAHPGPFLYYATAPLYRLTSGDPRSMAWTAAILNTVVVAGVGAVAWRRGRLALLTAAMILVALLVHGLGPNRLVDLWNPYLGLLPFLLVVFLAWDAALGRPRSLLPAAVFATIAVQCHVSFAPLIGVVALWLAAWCRWSHRIVPTTGPDGSMVGVERPPSRWQDWRPVVRGGLIIAAVLSIPALLDLVFDTHNLASVVGHLVVGSGSQIGPGHGLGLVSRYTRPDGPWLGGAEPRVFGDVQGSGPAVALLVVALLAACTRAARRRGLVDVVALTTLTLALVLAAVPAASNLVGPLFTYLTQWLKVIGGLVWFTVGWSAWRLLEGRVVSETVRRAAGAVAGIALVAAAAWSYGPATQVELPAPMESAVVQDLRAQLADRLDPEQTYRIDGAADSYGHNAAGVIYYLISDGFEVLTSDGTAGLKWGHTHRWTSGDSYDVRVTIAVHYPGAWRDVYQECEDDPRVELIASHDQLHPGERARLEQLADEEFYAPGSLTDAEDAEASALRERNFRVGVFAGDIRCYQRRSDS